MDELSELINPSPEASIIDASTKLALEWADLQKPEGAEELAQAMSALVAAFAEGLKKYSDNAACSKSTQISAVRSARSLALYWYLDNKSASLDELISVLRRFIECSLQETQSA